MRPFLLTRLLVFVFLLGAAACSKKQTEDPQPKPDLVGRWDSQTVQLTLYDSDGRITFDETYYDNGNGTPRNAYILLRADKSYASYTDDVLSWSGNYVWNGTSLTMNNPIQGSMDFTITTLSPTELTLTNDRRVGKAGELLSRNILGANRSYLRGMAATCTVCLR
ncbi:hypothetical protein [Hymenobacter cellulosilyticus]|uniref:Lipocalin-like domain-containing protein n=1 Tax=Hymenobacter cellulosilyticus TaxID=2932248 RepID=A0A8T9PZ05_9BACT|nr:hypothetical protein [Hymenobacter cellulosilyticus]UOQ70327.1 hypothetical protein MUN79_16430 [Hymenobacter cellulosilyticus]